MQYLTGIYMTDGVYKNGCQYPLRSLEMVINKGREGAPSSISHDITRTFGRSYVNGLYLSHELSYVIGKTVIAETDDEAKIINRANAENYNLTIKEAVDKHLKGFSSYLQSKGIFSNNGRFNYQNIVTYEKVGIVAELFPKLVEKADEDGLFLVKDILKDFKYAGQGIFIEKYKDFAILLHPYLRLSQNKYNDFDDNFLRALMDEYNCGNETLKFQIDLNAIGYKPSLTKSHVDDFWLIPDYDDKIDFHSYKLASFKTSEYDSLFNLLDRTEYVWKKEKEVNIHQVEIEEVRQDPTPALSGLSETYGCRYIHAMYNDKQKSIVHFDGAIRAYSLDKMIDRIDAPMTQSGHDTDYTKIFRIDGSVKVATWKRIVTSYLKNNSSVYDYFEVQAPKETISVKDLPADPLQKYVPYIINKEDGVRIYISYHPKVVASDERFFCTSDLITTENGKEKCMEFQAIEVAKCIWKCGGKLELPQEGRYLIVEDYYHNIPMIMHGDTNTSENIKVTLAGIRKLMERHSNRQDDDVYSFCLSWNMEDMNVCLSFFGHNADLHRWLKKVNTIPTNHKEFVTWIEAQSRFIKKKGRDSVEPTGNNLIKSDGYLYLQRRCTHQDAEILNYNIKENSYEASIQILNNDKELYDLLQNQKVHFAPELISTGAKCRGTNEDYLATEKSGIFGEVEYIPDVKMLGFVWTTKPRPICFDNSI